MFIKNKRLLISITTIIAISISIIIAYLLTNIMGPKESFLYVDEAYLYPKSQQVKAQNGKEKDVSATGNYIVKNGRIETDCPDQKTVVGPIGSFSLMDMILNGTRDPEDYNSYYVCLKDSPRGTLYIYNPITKKSSPLDYNSSLYAMNGMDHKDVSSDVKVSTKKYSSDGFKVELSKPKYTQNEKYRFTLTLTNGTINKEIKISDKYLLKDSQGYGPKFLGWIKE